MNERDVIADIAEAETKERSGISLVWLIPILAVLIGVWLVVKAYSEKGTTITISFKAANGLIAGKTKIKYKDVVVGKVTEINLSEDLSGVVVTAELDDSKQYLNDKTSFWVVRARVAAGQVSGLGTLFSGAYIGIDPVEGGTPSRNFKGLERPPAVTTDEQGKEFMLHAARLGSLDIGAPIYYRQLKVGEVQNYALDETGKTIDIKIFVYAPYDQYVYEQTQFWNAGGLDMSIDAEGVKVNTESFVTFLLGGIAFDTPSTMSDEKPAEEGENYWLYKNFSATKEKIYTQKSNFILQFDGSVRGLIPGAPVEFKGIKIGQVTEIKPLLDLEKNIIFILVLIEIEEGHFEYVGINAEEYVGNMKQANEEKAIFMERLVTKGLRAQLRTGNILTGKLLVDLGFHAGAPPAKVVYGGLYPELPTTPATIGNIAAKLANVMDKIGNFPIEKIGVDLQKTIENVSQLTAKLDKLPIDQIGSDLQKTASGLEKTVSQTKKTMAGLERLLRPESPLQHDLRKSLREFSEAARSLRLMADYLEQHPEALIRGKEKK